MHGKDFLTMLIMALESATQGSSVAVWQTGKILASCRQDNMTRSQAEMLVPMVKEALGKARILFADINLFAVTVGPGSFTGVRVGLATARGLGLATARPVAGVTTMETVAWTVSTKQGSDRNYCGRYILVALETYRAAFYVQPFLLTAILPVPLCPVQTLVPTEISDFLEDFPKHVIVVGDDLSRLTTYLPANMQVVSGMQPQAWAVAAIAAAREATGRLAPEPLYAQMRAMTTLLPKAESFSRDV